MDKDLFRKGEGDIIGAYREIMDKLIEICWNKVKKQLKRYY